MIKSALQTAKDIRSNKIAVTEVVKETLDKIIKHNQNYNAFLHVADEYALTRARKVQDALKRGDKLSPLAGIPIAVKDNISVMGMPMTCASKMLDGYMPAYNATVIDKLENAGLIIVGKLNMDEFAMGGKSETGYRGAVRNPYDTARVAGGSSGGSAAAVAAGLVPLALGTDTGGSIRQPSSFCGVVGIKPTYGSVSRYGVVAFASSLDQIGPIANNVEDCSALLEIISGECQRDATCILTKPPRLSGVKLQGLKVGLARNCLDYDVDECVQRSVLDAAAKLSGQGLTITDIDMPYVDYAVHAYCAIAWAEGSSNLARFDGVTCGKRSPYAVTLSDAYRMSRGEGFGYEVKKRIMLGNLILSSEYCEAYYNKARKVRTLIKQAYDKLFERYDVILAPVTSRPAFRSGMQADPVKMYTGDLFTVGVNLAGLSGISVPAGLSKDGLPIGVQIIGKAFDEAKIISAAKVIEKMCQNNVQAHTKAKRSGKK